MTHIDIKEQVRGALSSAWPMFERDHPHLAGAIDRELLVAQASKSIADDPEFQEAMTTASSAGILAEAIAGLVPGMVTRWLRSLI